MKKNLDKIALIDDDPFIVEGWKILATDIEIYPYDSPASFLAAVSSDQTLLNELKTVVTDLYFDTDEADGYTLARKLRLLRSDLPILLISNALNPDLSLFDGRLAKEPASDQTLGESIADALALGK